MFWKRFRLIGTIAALLLAGIMLLIGLSQDAPTASKASVNRGNAPVFNTNR